MIAPIRSNVRTSDLPPLQNGDRLDAQEFCRRWDVTPQLKHAELIGGEVYMNPPVSAGAHGKPHWQMNFWLGNYVVATDGLETISESSVHFGPQDLPQPDALLRIKEQFGGTSRMVHQELHGTPELIVEVAASCASYDLHNKKEQYSSHGVQEYLVWVVRERKFVWFHLENGDFAQLPQAKNGVIKSQIFPGLWLDTKAMLADNWPKILETLRRGMETDDYRVFAANLKSQLRKKRKS